MTIVDTSVWVDQYLGKGTPLDRLLEHEEAVLHLFAFGELLLGGLSREAVRDLSDLPKVAPASTAEVAAGYGLTGTGIGYVDTHLLVTANLIHGGRLLTRDRKLHAQAERLGLAHV